MDIIKIPTDNLYKFMAIFGGISFLFFFIMPQYLIYNIKIKDIKNKEERTILKNEMESLKKEVKKTFNAVNKKQTNVNKIKNDFKKMTIEVRDKIKTNNLSKNEKEKILNKLNKKEKNLFQIRQELKIDRKQNKKHLTLVKKQYVTIVKMKTKLELKKYQYSVIQKLSWMSLIGTPVSYLIMIFGFFMWYIKVQKPLDKKAHV